MSETHILNPELGSKPPYVPWSHPWPVCLKPLSHEPGQTISLHSAPVRQPSGELLLQVLQLCKAIASFENSGLLSEHFTNKKISL